MAQVALGPVIVELFLQLQLTRKLRKEAGGLAEQLCQQVEEFLTHADGLAACPTAEQQTVRRLEAVRELYVSLEDSKEVDPDLVLEAYERCLQQKADRFAALPCWPALNERVRGLTVQCKKRCGWSGSLLEVAKHRCSRSHLLVVPSQFPTLEKALQHVREKGPHPNALAAPPPILDPDPALEAARAAEQTHLRDGVTQIYIGAGEHLCCAKVDVPVFLFGPYHASEDCTGAEAIQACLRASDKKNPCVEFVPGSGGSYVQHIQFQGYGGGSVIAGEGEQGTLVCASEGASTAPSFRTCAVEGPVGVRVEGDFDLRPSFEDCLLKGKKAAVEVRGKCRAELMGNRVMEAHGHVECGISVTGDCLATLLNNEISGCCTGLDFREKAHGRIEHNEIYDCSKDGMEFWGNVHPNVQQNKVRQCEGAGVCYRNTSRGQLLENEIFSNLDGVRLLDAATVEVAKNRIHSNSAHGLLCKGMNESSVEQNEVSHNGVGIQAEGQAKTFFQQNEVQEQKGDGIVLGGSNEAAAQRNHVHANVGVGIRIAGGTPVFSGNQVQGNQAGSILVEEKGNGKVLGNVCSEPGNILGQHDNLLWEEPE